MKNNEIISNNFLINDLFYTFTSHDYLFYNNLFI